MKWIAAILLVANVLIFLGISDRQVESRPGRDDTRPDVNRESMLLIKEVKPEKVDAEVLSSPALIATEDLPLVTADPADDLPETILTDDRPALLSIDTDGIARVDTPETSPPVPESEPGADSQETGVESRAIVDYSCYRIGPFRDEGSWNAAVTWAEEQQWQFERVRSESRELRAVRVYIGPYESIASSQSTTDMLKEKELDHFVYLREGKARISLGYFTQEELAAKYVEYLNGQGIDARSQPEYRTLGPFDWMEVRVESSQRRQLLDRQWNVDDVNTTEQECDADSSG